MELANSVPEHVREHCRQNGIRNVGTLLGKVDDALFPKVALDVVFMVWIYHHMEEPVVMLRSVIPSLKPGPRLSL